MIKDDDGGMINDLPETPVEISAEISDIVNKI